METLTLVFWRVHFLPIPVCHWVGVQKLWEATVSSLDQTTDQALGMQERSRCPKPDGQNGSHILWLSPHGTRGIHHRISRGQFGMPSTVPHYWRHLAAPRISHSEQWELIPIYLWPRSPLQVWLRSSLTCNENVSLPSSSVRPFVDWDSCCDLRVLAQARYFQSTELFIWHLSVLTVGNWGTGHCPGSLSKSIYLHL